MNAYRISLVILLAATVMLSGCFAARLPPLTNYSLPMTKKVTLATCKPSKLTETDKQKINYVDTGLQKALEQAGFKVSRVGCKEAWTPDSHSVKVTDSFGIWPYPLTDWPDTIEVAVYLLPPGKKLSAPIFHGFYGNPRKGGPPAAEVFPKIPPVLFKAIKIGQHNAMKAEKGQAANSIH